LAVRHPEAAGHRHRARRQARPLRRLRRRDVLVLPVVPAIGDPARVRRRLHRAWHRTRVRAARARLPFVRGARHGGGRGRRPACPGRGKRDAAVAEIIALLGPNASLTEQLAARLQRAREASADFRETAEKLLIDIAGLCVAARATDYVRAAIAGWEGAGHCTAIGHARALDAAGAAFVNGTAAHGEDFDDTFEGGPVHAGAVIVPAVLAACERHNPDGRMALAGIAVGTEVLCRLSLVVPKAVHKAGFHPTAIFGAMGAAAGVGAALGLDAKQLVDALGIAGSMASGIIEYLAEGAWTKRLHPGWAAQAGMRAALLGRAGFLGPRTVLEGVHGLFHGFAHTTEGYYDAVVGDFGRRWVTETLAFKPYPCGTMAHPYIDCAKRLAARGIKADDIAEMVCEVGEGTVHRLCEPLADKQKPRNGYAAKFAVPYLLAEGFVHGNVGLDAFTETAVRDQAVLALAAKVRYV